MFSKEPKKISFKYIYIFLIRKVCRSTYDIAPNVKIDGHVDSSFPYITTPLSYIVPEMLNNAFR
jgi:hypothetical protein